MRAVFVPEGEDPPSDFSAALKPLRMAATYDPTTGEITCEEPNQGSFGGIRAEFRPDLDQDSDDGSDFMPGAQSFGAAPEGGMPRATEWSDDGADDSGSWPSGTAPEFTPARAPENPASADQPAASAAGSTTSDETAADDSAIDVGGLTSGGKTRDAGQSFQTARYAPAGPLPPRITPGVFPAAPENDDLANTPTRDLRTIGNIPNNEQSDEKPDGTELGRQREDEARIDPNRDVGDSNGVQTDGRTFTDSETGNAIHVDGDKIVIVDSGGNRVTEFRNSEANTQRRTRSGRWLPN